jgi:hypothetical protein
MPNFPTCLKALVLSLAACGFGAAHAAAIVPGNELVNVTFNFNDINLALKTNTGYGVGNVAVSNGTKTDGIALSMTAALQQVSAKSAVTIVGAVATQSYNGEGRVTTGTLGTTEGGVASTKVVNGVTLKVSDTFLVNNNFGLKQQTSTTAVTGGATYDRFSLNFSDFVITSVQFDYEIFPNATCQKKSGCGPDMALLVNGVQQWYDSVAASNVTDPTKLGTTGAISFVPTGGVAGTKLTFVDWPAIVGIDNLRITGCAKTVNGVCGFTPPPSDVPEPITLALLGAGLFGLGASRVRARSKKA